MELIGRLAIRNTNLINRAIPQFARWQARHDVVYPVEEKTSEMLDAVGDTLDDELVW